MKQLFTNHNTNGNDTNHLPLSSNYKLANWIRMFQNLVIQAKVFVVLLLLLIFFATLNSKAQTISTVAGGGVGDGAAATSAQISPSGVVVDASGNIYISDPGNNLVRKVTASTGIISTVAGNGNNSYSGDGGAATSAQIVPTGVALDASGNIYIADQYNLRVRKVTASTGIITTVAGNGSFGYSGEGGAATSAQISPTAVAVDASGNIYIADGVENIILKVSASTGIINIFAGNGTQGFNGDGIAATSAQLSSPAGLTADASGNIFILDAGNYRIRKVTVSTGIITTVAGDGSYGYSGDGGAATLAGLYNPSGVALDASGNIYISETQRIRKVTASTGIITTVAGNGSFGFSGDGGPAISAQMSNYGVAIDASGNIYIIGNYRVRKVTASTGTIATVAGHGIDGLSGAGGLATSAGFNSPRGVVLDASENIYFSLGGLIAKVTASTGIINSIAGNGNITSVIDGVPATTTGLNGPVGVALDASGNIYIADQHNNRIRKVTASTGIITTIAGNGTQGYSGDGGAATSAKLFYPYYVALDASGNIYFSDFGNIRIRKITASTGIITTVAGNGTPGNSGDGSAATSAQLSNPMGVAVDASGNIYFADSYNHRIRKVTASTGIITTVAGIGTMGSTGDGGLAILAELSFPTDLELDASGNIYIADGDRIRKVTAGTGIITTIVSGFLNTIGGIALDVSGNIYISQGDQSNVGDRILKVPWNYTPLTINTSAVNTTSCAGISINVPFTVSGTINSGNVFTAQLSDATGSFASPVVIGNVTSTTSGTINAVIPALSAAGSSYRIRVVSSNPVVTGSDNGSNITISPAPTAPISGGNQTIISGSSATLSASPPSGSTVDWYSASSSGTLLLSGSNTYSTFTVGIYYAASRNITTGCVSSRRAISLTLTVATNNSPICTGGTLNLGGPDNMVSYLWTGPIGFTSSLQNPKVSDSATTVMSGTYTLKVTDSNGSLKTYTTYAYVFPIPVAIVSNNSPVCAGTLLKLTGNATSMATYSWTGPNGFTSSLYNPIVSASASTNMSGTYTFTVTTSKGCAKTASTNVVVNPVPAIPIASSNSPVCAGTQLVLTGGPDSMALYLWTGPHGIKSTLQSPVIASNYVVATRSGNYTLKVTNSYNCSNSVTTAVTINPLPVPVVTNNGPVCAGTTLTISGGPDGMTSYSWTGPKGFTSISENPLHTDSATVAMSGVYYLSIVDLNGCSKTAYTRATVNPLPNANVSNNGPVCSGTSLKLKVSPTSYTTYSWTGPNGYTDSIYNPVVSDHATLDMSGVYYFTATTIKGCVKSSSTNVTVNPSPTVPTASSNSPVCAGNPLILTGGPDNMSSYLWTGPLGIKSTLQSPVIASMYVVATRSGNYTLKVTNSYNCSNSVSTAVIINPLPVAAASYSSPLYAGNVLNLYGLPNDMAMYSWTGPNSFSSPFQNPTATNSASTKTSGMYRLTVMDINGCTKTTSVNVMLTMLKSAEYPSDYSVSDTSVSGSPGIKINEISINNTDVSKSIKFNIYPNPTKGLLNIEYSNPGTDKILVEVFNIMGGRIYEKEFLIQNSLINTEINLTSNPKGIYLIRINNSLFKDKIVLQ
jgi:trimeric autotransporter adhesin